MCPALSASLATGLNGSAVDSQRIRPASHRLHNNLRPRRRSTSGPSTNPARGNNQKNSSCLATRGSRRRQCMASRSYTALVAGCHLERAAASRGPSRRCLRDGPPSGLRRGLARGMTLETPGCQDGFKTPATALGVNRSDGTLATRMIGNLPCATGFSIEPSSDMRDVTTRHLSCIYNLMLFS